MSQWLIKEMSKLTKISVRMLHHYDKIGLLKPSVRASNGYRLYSKHDLAKLQQVIALKFFGFGLKQIKTMLLQTPDVHKHLLAQQKMLSEQAENLRQAQDAIQAVLQRSDSSNSLDWKELIALIERYHIAKELKKSWVGKLYNEEQQDRYVAFKQAHLNNVGAWEKAIESINAGKLGDPEGPAGEDAVKAFLKYTKALVAWETTTKKASRKVTLADATELLELINKFKTEGMPLNADGNMWLAKAQIAHQLRCWEQLHKDITENLDANPDGAVGNKLANQWRELVAQSCMWGSIEFFFGVKLLMDAAQAKAQIHVPAMLTPEQQKIVQDNLGLLCDPMALSWIEKALKAN
ncbi:MAG: hypothetical protein US49_C0006G0162 [candidate division TM6 bacterium GW2011_GWF2_37_49]|nr:MAG: hypothetical protein US49_C0006G0162 [candidate division TM6 bacterium GW2011_GWF2_37_49]